MNWPLENDGEEVFYLNRRWVDLSEDVNPLYEVIDELPIIETRIKNWYKPLVRMDFYTTDKCDRDWRAREGESYAEALLLVIGDVIEFINGTSNTTRGQNESNENVK